MRSRTCALFPLLTLMSTAAAPPPPGRRPSPQPAPYVSLGHTGFRSVMTWSPDGRTLATGAFDDTVVLWNADGWKPRATLAGHRSVIVSLAWSKDGRTLAASDANDRTIVWDAATGKRRLTLAGGLLPLRLSPDFLYPDPPPGTAAPLSLPNPHVLVTSVRGQCALLWDATTGRRRAVLKAPGETPDLVMASSPDGRTLAIGSADRPETVDLWDMDTGKPRLRIPARTFVTALLWSSDSRVLAIGQIQSVVLCDAVTGRPRAVLEDIDGQQTDALAWSPDGHMLAGATGGDPQQVCLWDTQAAQRLRALPPHSALSGSITLAWSPHSTTLAVSDSTTTALWDVATGKRLHTLPDARPPLAWKPDGRTLATASADFPLHAAILWNGLTGEPRTYLSPRLSPVLKGGLTWSSDSRTLLTASRGGEGGTAAAWDATTGRQQAVFFDSDAYELRWSPNAQLVALASLGEAQVWDRHARRVRAHISGIWLSGTGTQVAWSPGSDPLALPSNRYLALPSNRYQAVIWDVPASRDLAIIPGATGPTKYLGGSEADSTYAWTPSWSPDGRTLVTAGPDGDQTILLWDIATRQVRVALHGRSASVNAVSWSPDSRWVASGAYDGTVNLWNAITGARLRTWQAPALGCWGLRGSGGIEGRWLLAWAPGAGTLAAAVSGSGNAWLWDTGDGRLRAIIPTDTKGIHALAWSPDGNILAIAANDHTIRLWDRRNRRWRAILRGHTGPITALASSPDGHRLASGGIDGSARLWSAPAGRELVDLYTFDQGKEWLAITPEGYFAASAHGADVIQWRQGDELWPLAKFRRRFERPDLVRLALGEQSARPGSRR